MTSNIDFDDLTFDEISNLNLSFQEKIDIILNRITNFEKKEILDAWENGKLNQHLLLPFYARREDILTSIVKPILKEEEVEVSRIKELYLDDPGKIEFKVYDDTTRKSHLIHLYACEDERAYVILSRCGGLDYPRFDESSRSEYKIFLCKNRPHEEIDLPLYTLLHGAKGGDGKVIDLNDIDGFGEYHELHFIIEDYHKFENKDLYNIGAYLNGENIDCEFSSTVDSYINEVKQDEALKMEFTLKYIKFVLRLDED